MEKCLLLIIIQKHFRSVATRRQQYVQKSTQRNKHTAFYKCKIFHISELQSSCAMFTFTVCLHFVYRLITLWLLRV